MDKLTETTIAHDLEMIIHRFRAAVSDILASDEQITPVIAYHLEFLDAERARLDTHISTH